MRKIKSIYNLLFKKNVINNKQKVALLLLIPLVLMIWDLHLILNLPIVDSLSKQSTSYFILLGIMVLLFVFIILYATLKTKLIKKQELATFETKTKIDLNKLCNCGVKEFNVKDNLIVKVSFKDDKLIVKSLVIFNDCPIADFDRISALTEDTNLSKKEIHDKINENLDYYFETKTREIDYCDVEAIGSSNWYKGHFAPDIFVVFRIPLPKSSTKRDTRSYSQKQIENELFGENSQEFKIEYSNELFYQLAKHNIKLTNVQALNAKPLDKKPKFKAVLEANPINSMLAYITTTLIFLSGLLVSIFFPHLIFVSYLTTIMSIYLFIKLANRPNIKVSDSYLSTPQITAKLSEVQSIKIYTKEHSSIYNSAYIHIKTPTHTFKILSNKKNRESIKKYFSNDIIKYI